MLFLHFISFLNLCLNLGSKYFCQLFSVPWYVWSSRQFCDSNTTWSWIQMTWLKSGISWQLYFCVVASVFTQILIIMGMLFDFEPNLSRTTYLTSIWNSYCRVPFTYHISWDKCSQKPQNLAWLSESAHTWNKKCRSITGPLNCIKSRVAKKDWKGNEELWVPWGSQVLCYLWTNLTKAHVLWGSSERKLHPCQMRLG